MGYFGKADFLTHRQAVASAQALALPTDRLTLRRVVRAHNLVKSGNIRPLEDGSFAVTSQFDDDLTYTVSINSDIDSCSCPDQTNPCKHTIACIAWQAIQDAAIQGREPRQVIERYDHNYTNYRCLIGEEEEDSWVTDNPNPLTAADYKITLSGNCQKQLPIREQVQTLKAAIDNDRRHDLLDVFELSRLEDQLSELESEYRRLLARYSRDDDEFTQWTGAGYYKF